MDRGEQHTAREGTFPSSEEYRPPTGREIPDKHAGAKRPPSITAPSIPKNPTIPRGVHYLDRHGNPSAKPDITRPEIYAVMTSNGTIIETATVEIQRGIIQEIGLAVTLRNSINEVTGVAMMTYRAIEQARRERLQIPTDIPEDAY